MARPGHAEDVAAQARDARDVAELDRGVHWAAGVRRLARAEAGNRQRDHRAEARAKLAPMMHSSSAESAMCHRPAWLRAPRTP